MKNKNYHKSVTNEEWFLFKMSGKKVQGIAVDMNHRFSSLLELNAVASSLHVIFLHATNPPDHSMAATRLPTLLPPGPNPLREGKTHIILFEFKGILVVLSLEMKRSSFVRTVDGSSEIVLKLCQLKNRQTIYSHTLTTILKNCLRD